MNWFPLQSLHDKWENKGHAVCRFSFLKGKDIHAVGIKSRMVGESQT
jgi:hypothetical protein